VEWDWEKSEAEFIKSLAGNPNHSLSHAYYGHLLLIVRRFEEAVKEVNTALDLDPNNPLVLSLAGVVHFHTGDTERAFELLNRSYQIDPNNILNHRIIETYHFQAEEYDEALEMQKKILQSDPASRQAMEEAYTNGDYLKAMQALARAKESLSKDQFVAPVWVALAYNRAGLHAEAIQWLERGFQMHDQDLPYVFIVKEFNSLRQDPRFGQIAQKMNLAFEETS
ncbi:MAG: tetratricopeptide repeat protein, partial [Bacteroidota bacterium]